MKQYQIVLTVLASISIGTVFGCHKDIGKKNILHNAVIFNKNNPNILQLALNKIHPKSKTEYINAVDQDQFTPLLFALKAQDYKAMALLIKHGANPNLLLEGPYQQFKQHNTTYTKKKVAPLHLAAAHNDVKGIQTLAENGADIDLIDTAGDTALMVAIKKKSSQAVQILLHLGANPDTSPNGTRMLTFANKHYPPFMFNLLLAKAKPSKQEQDIVKSFVKETLKLAIKDRNTKAFNLLVEITCNLNLIDIKELEAYTLVCFLDFFKNIQYKKHKKSHS